MRAQVLVKPGKLLTDWLEWARTTFQSLDIVAFHTVLPPTSHILHGSGLAMEEWGAASNDVEQSFYLFPSVSKECWSRHNGLLKKAWLQVRRTNRGTQGVP